jgi:hypothetical protein
MSNGRGGDVIEREAPAPCQASEYGTRGGHLRPARRRRYNVRGMKSPLFEAGDKMVTGTRDALCIHYPNHHYARGIPRPRPSMLRAPDRKGRSPERESAAPPKESQNDSIPQGQRSV